MKTFCSENEKCQYRNRHILVCRNRVAADHIDQMKTVKYGDSDYQVPEFWSQLIAIAPKKGKVGEAIVIDHYAARGHVLDVEVTVTRP
ncbi:hypothetical protein ALP58_01511 [Pseudomonas savastanoi]|uniref:Uncharacterized protein n=3 Tax=Pseudomonas syringae group TaxID=136849 RepID=A0A0P9N5Q3_PSESX|nr:MULTISPECIES: hypothetical protein [Pseudomonas syringae group]KPW92784.1 Uncharacterized protein ALO79_02996 [Pseudomonas syringae pv. castaneae]RMS95589.1 hypothetical protein ALP58_01511 [Pseudomonas savastanoi]